MVDILAVYELHLPFLWVSKAENFYAPFLGWNMWLNGYIPLKRGHLPSIRRMLRTCEARLREGASLCVFPEGTRSRDGNLRAFYRGAFWIAVRNRVPIVPVVVEGTFAILSKGSFGIRPRPVTLHVLDPIFPEQAGGDDRRLRDLTFERMREQLARQRSSPAYELHQAAASELS
jgi:1-acyl-sn-glycerol-3-phosphate acyltransferase